LQVQLSSADVLKAFRSDELRLFVAAASITVGLVAIGFSFIRRKFDRLLSFFAWFAVLYGCRLWMQTSIHNLMAGPSPFIVKLRMALNFFVSIPAFLFFEASGLLGRAGRIITYAACLLELSLIVALLFGAPLLVLDHLNSLVIIAGSVSLVSLAFRQRVMTRDTVVFRTGLAIFVGLVLWTNVSELLGNQVAVEFYGYAVLLCCLGYVAARQALDRDQQLSMVRQELEIARRIQLSILPSASPSTARFSVAARYRPMTSVAGDFYEFIDVGNGAIGLLVADVSGHGVPAALIASMLKIAIQSQYHQANDPAMLLAGINEVLCGNTQNQFVTAAYVYLDTASDQFCYAAAGHPPMMLLRDGQVAHVEENGLVLGLIRSARYQSVTQSLRAGDRILLYTDGILEAADINGGEFGYERLSQSLQKSGSGTAEQAADMILKSVDSWAPSQSDDLTVVICDYE
jgi:phosphoserine phosphatase RsbU/P